MLTTQQVNDLVLESIVAVNEEKQGGEQIPVSPDTILLGSGSPLDSLDFILLVTNIEERLHSKTGREVELSSDLQSFEEYNPFRTVTTLCEHIAVNLLSD